MLVTRSVHQLGYYWSGGTTAADNQCSQPNRRPTNVVDWMKTKTTRAPHRYRYNNNVYRYTQPGITLHFYDNLYDECRVEVGTHVVCEFSVIVIVVVKTAQIHNRNRQSVIPSGVDTRRSSLSVCHLSSSEAHSVSPSDGQLIGHLVVILWTAVGEWYTSNFYSHGSVVYFTIDIKEWIAESR